MSQPLEATELFRALNLLALDEVSWESAEAHDDLKGFLALGIEDRLSLDAKLARLKSAVMADFARAEYT